MRNNRQTVIDFSGGICSWWAARRYIDRHGTGGVTLRFADTNFEDADLYRFLEEASADLGVPVTRLADGRTPWDVFRDNRFIGNTRVDLCSRILKRALLDRHLEENFDRSRTVIVIGMSYGEKGRYIKFRARMRAKGWMVQAPAMAPPYLSKLEMIEKLYERGIDPPGLYDDGFPHNNCGGFCVKAGQAQFRLLLAKRREFYLFNENKEQELIQLIGKDVAILRDRRGGVTKPMTLRTFRERVEGGEVMQCADWGGCGCAIDD